METCCQQWRTTPPAPPPSIQTLCSEAPLVSAVRRSGLAGGSGGRSRACREPTSLDESRARRPPPTTTPTHPSASWRRALIAQTRRAEGSLSRWRRECQWRLGQSREPDSGPGPSPDGGGCRRIDVRCSELPALRDLLLRAGGWRSSRVTALKADAEARRRKAERRWTRRRVLGELPRCGQLAIVALGATRRILAG